MSGAADDDAAAPPPSPWAPPTAAAWAAAGAATSPCPPLSAQDDAHATALTGASAIIATLASSGHLSLVAGGWVRDALLGRPSADVDVATAAPVATITAAFDRVVPMPNDTVIVSTTEHGAFEVAPFRGGGEEEEVEGEGGGGGAAADHRSPPPPLPPPPLPPPAALAAAARDARLRDFTVNALFYDPASRLVIDFVGGVADIGARTLRGCGADPAARLAEDPLRCVRAVRFAAALGLDIHPDTAAAVASLAPACTPPAVAVERVWREVVKLGGAEDAPAAGVGGRPGAFADGLATARRLGLLPVILPELCGDGADPQAADDALRRLGPGVPAVLRLAAALPAGWDLGPPGPSTGGAAAASAATSTTAGPPPPGTGAAALATRLKLSRKEATALWALAGLRALDRAAGRGEEVDPLAWVRWYAGPSAPSCLAVEAARLACEADRAAYMSAHDARRAAFAPAIARAREGRTLLTAARARAGGVRPGRALGELLTAAERVAAVSGIEDVEALVEAVKEAGLWPAAAAAVAPGEEEGGARKRAR